MKLQGDIFIQLNSHEEGDENDDDDHIAYLRVLLFIVLDVGRII